MPVAQNIVRMYRRPRAVVSRLLAQGPREDRALAYLMGGCLLTFVSLWPPMAREAYIAQDELQPRIGAALLAWLFIAPLVFYALAGLSTLAARVIGHRIGAYAGRLALFWAWLAATPLLLLHGLTAGLVGPGPALSLVGAVWLVVFLWFWVSGLRESAAGVETARGAA
ncbi:YIP1 family protein [Poseidonocella sedimentorum]|uniref:Yip1 domain-containing protein n=1 Tax=Poseidonocella sedimentorum TaxID=871652 RepID=A0A1I6EP88_9RHOB|nr:YIP1 family protein [Poseidonocella sedimentorum]SFR19564.1 hypothetical protein SAMN04515673_11721 [Poseidonocella sedimentorum]